MVFIDRAKTNYRSEMRKFSRFLLNGFMWDAVHGHRLLCSNDRWHYFNAIGAYFWVINANENRQSQYPWNVMVHKYWHRVEGAIFNSNLMVNRELYSVPVRCAH